MRLSGQKVPPCRVELFIRKIFSALLREKISFSDVILNAWRNPERMWGFAVYSWDFIASPTNMDVWVRGTWVSLMLFDFWGKINVFLYQAAHSNTKWGTTCQNEVSPKWGTYLRLNSSSLRKETWQSFFTEVHLARKNVIHECHKYRTISGRKSLWIAANNSEEYKARGKMEYCGNRILSFSEAYLVNTLVIKNAIKEAPSLVLSVLRLRILQAKRKKKVRKVLY